MDIDFVYLDYDESVPTQKTADGFTCTVSLSSNKDRFVNLSIYDGYLAYEYRIKYNSASDTVEFVVPPATAAENSAVVDKSTILAPSLVKRYITTDENGDVEKILEEIRAISDKICEGLDSDYDKLRAISRWVSDNIYYDYPAHDAGIPEECLSLEYMLDKHSSVCGGYSNMTSALCAAQGITCYNVKGYALTGDVTYAETSSGEAYHEWNYAIIDGRVIWVDSGWNSHNYYRSSGTYDYNGISYKYFDVSLEAFSQDHRCVSAEIRDYYALLED